jgi:hypothetical protein
MALQGVLGNNTKIGFSASSPVSYTKIGQLMNIDKFPELVANIVDTTVMGTSNQMTGMTGMIPIPSFEFTLLADLDQATSPAHETIRQYSAGAGGSQSGTVIWFRIEVPVNTAKTSYRAFEFQGIVNGWNLSTPIADKQTLKITVVLSTAISVYNAAASLLG